MNLYLKDPQGVVDQAIDWSAYLATQAIAQSLWSVAPDEEGGIAVEDSDFTPQATSARLSGGRVGHIYRVTNRVTLSDGQVDERSMTFRVEER